MSNDTDKFESWAIIELFGHQQIAGLVSEAALGGCAFLRVDVPAVDDDRPAFTRFFGNGAIYSMTPVTQETARAAVQRLRARPITIYGLELPQLTATIEDLDEEGGRTTCPDCGADIPADGTCFYCETRPVADFKEDMI